MLEQFSTTQPSKKLQPRRWGPTKIKEIISKHIVKIQLPRNLKQQKVTDLYNISRLEPAANSVILGQHQEPPPPVIVDGEEEWEVEEILDGRKKRNSVQYLVRWKGGEEDWRTPQELTDCQQLLEDFYTKYPRKPRPSQAS